MKRPRNVHETARRSEDDSAYEGGTNQGGGGEGTGMFMFLVTCSIIHPSGCESLVRPPPGGVLLTPPGVSRLYDPLRAEYYLALRVLSFD